jgi:hypothetical protein
MAISFSPPPRISGPAICIVCGKTHGGSVKRHRKLRDQFEMKTPGNWDMCDEHKKLHQEGYIALVEAIQPSHTLQEDGEIIAGGDPHRTGKVIHVRYELAEQLFQTAIDRSLPMVFCLPDVATRMADMNSTAADGSKKSQGF